MGGLDECELCPVWGMIFSPSIRNMSRPLPFWLYRGSPPLRSTELSRYPTYGFGSTDMSALSMVPVYLRGGWLVM